MRWQILKTVWKHRLYSGRLQPKRTLPTENKKLRIWYPISGRRSIRSSYPRADGAKVRSCIRLRHLPESKIKIFASVRSICSTSVTKSILCLARTNRHRSDLLTLGRSGREYKKVLLANCPQIGDRERPFE